MKRNNIVMHVDVNSAFLAWQAAYNRQIGREGDIRKIPSVVGGNEKKRHGIVLAKSIPAKKLGIKTGQSLMEARQKCKNLLVIPPNYDLYIKASKALRELFEKYTSKIDIFSIDECFLNFAGNRKATKNPEGLAYEIKERVKNEFGFTVNVGVSTNKLLSKQASEFSKPDKVHTLFPEEIEEKLWPLPVGELFMVGVRTKPKLNRIGINTIGDLANSDYDLLSAALKSHGRLIYNYARGIDDSMFSSENKLPFKGVGNGSTIHFDVEDTLTAYKILLSLVEMASKRLREADMQCRVIAVGIKNKDFGYMTHQRKIPTFTNCTYEIFKNVKELFSEMWNGKPIRHMNVRLTDLEIVDKKQVTFFQDEYSMKMEQLDGTIDMIREKYGKYSIIRAEYIESGLKPVLGGYPVDDYPDMTSIL